MCRWHGKWDREGGDCFHCGGAGALSWAHWVSRSLLPSTERRRVSPSRGEQMAWVRPGDWKYLAKSRRARRAVWLLRAVCEGPRRRAELRVQGLEGTPRVRAFPQDKRTPTKSIHPRKMSVLHTPGMGNWVSGRGQSAAWQRTARRGLPRKLLQHLGKTLGAPQLGKWGPEAEWRWRQQSPGAGRAGWVVMSFAGTAPFI